MKNSHLPLAYQRGYQHFYKQTLHVIPGVFIPRSDTESLVVWSVHHIPARSRVLELGIGTGAICIALACDRPDLMIQGVEKDLLSYGIARRNIRLYDVSIDVRLGDWFSNIDQRYDVIISNPPYVGNFDAVGSCTIFEPRAALFSGLDGYEDLQHIILNSVHHLNLSGMLILEHGSTQGDRVGHMMRDAGYGDITKIYDLSGHHRGTAGIIKDRHLTGHTC